jgi:hypothetical protein
MGTRRVRPGRDRLRPKESPYRAGPRSVGAIRDEVLRRMAEGVYQRGPNRVYPGAGAILASRRPYTMNTPADCVFDLN